MNSDPGFLYSIVLRLHPLRETTIAATMGHQAHAAFLATVRRADRALAEVLHNAPLPVKPFTVSPLLGSGQAINGRILVHPERTYSLRFTVLYDEIFQQFMRRFLQSDTRPTLHLGPAEFQIREVLVTPGSHVWAGYTACTELVQQVEPARLINLRFTSPTAFSRNTSDGKKRFLIFPTPEAVFDSLARTWNFWAPGYAVDKRALRTALAERGMVAGYATRSRMLHFTQHPQIGFVGQVTFDLGYLTAEQQRDCALLADFAFYSGVGYKTTMGMGQTRRVVE
jgi:CRISPR-associated endoribonuclease Cas6